MMLGVRDLARAIRPGLRIPTARFLRPLTAARGKLSTTSVSDAETMVKTEQMAHHVSELLKLLGEDPSRSGLLKTPQRVAKSLQFLTSGMEGEPAQVIGDAFFAETSDELVLVRDITVHSLCEHHMLPFHGKVHVAYVPDGRVVGLSKLARLSDLFSRRLQVQERLTQQIADALMAELAPRGVAVVMECAHMCMAMRGVQKPGATTLTSCMLGSFKEDPQLRSELFQQLNLPVAASRSSSSSVDPANPHAADGSCSCGVCLLDRRNGRGHIRDGARDHDASGGFRGVGTVSSKQPPKPPPIVGLSSLEGTTSCSSSGNASNSMPDRTPLRAFTAATTKEFCDDNDEDDVDITISLSKEDMKFSAGHFTIFDGAARETLHGHNFTVSAEVAFSPCWASAAADAADASSAAAAATTVASGFPKMPIGSVPNGLLMDYGILKRKLRDLCKGFDEVMLLPGQNTHLRIEQGTPNLGSSEGSCSSGSSSSSSNDGGSIPTDDYDNDSSGGCTKSDSETVRVVYGEGAGNRPHGSALLQGDEVFELPLRDVLVLPLANITGEELSRFLLEQFLNSCSEELLEGGAKEVTLMVSSGPGQSVTMRRKLRPSHWQQRTHNSPAPTSSSARSTSNRGSPVLASPNSPHHRSFSSHSRVGGPLRSFSCGSTGSSRAEVKERAAAVGTAVITGASSGIGLAVAEKFSSLGWHVHSIRCGLNCLLHMYAVSLFATCTVKILSAQ